MSAFGPIPPRRAAALVEEAQLGDAGRVLASFAAAGSVKSHARSIETVDASGKRSEVRDNRIPCELWRPIVEEDRAEDVWTIRTVRLAGSGLVGGDPTITLLGVRFDDVSLQAAVAQHSGTARSLMRAELVAPATTVAPVVEPTALPDLAGLSSLPSRTAR